MNTIQNKWIGVIALAGCLLVPLHAWAESLPSHYPKLFSWSGSLDQVNFAEQRVIVGDRVFIITPSTRAYRLRAGTSDALSDLTLGMKVGCKVSAGKYLVSIWELPDSYAGLDNVLK